MSSPPPYTSGGYPDRPPTHAPVPPAYGTPAPRSAPPRNGLGTTALVFGVLAVLGAVFVVGGLFGVIAIVLAVAGLVRVATGRATNRGVAIGGLVLGVLGLMIATAVAFALWGLSDDVGLPQFVDCVEKAGNNRGAAQQCRDQFEQRMQTWIDQT